MSNDIKKAIQDAVTALNNANTPKKDPQNATGQTTPQTTPPSSSNPSQPYPKP